MKSKDMKVRMEREVKTWIGKEKKREDTEYTQKRECKSEEGLKRQRKGEIKNIKGKRNTSK